MHTETERFVIYIPYSSIYIYIPYSSVIGYSPDPVENLSTYIQYSKPENTENLLSDPGTITICDHHSSTKTQTEFLNTPFRGNDCEMQD